MFIFYVYQISETADTNRIIGTVLEISRIKNPCILSCPAIL